MQNNLTSDETVINPLLRIEGLSKSYLQGRLGRRSTSIEAVSRVHFKLFPGQTLALAGASGSGKSTLARCIARLERPDSGEIWIDGSNIAQLGSKQLFPFRSKIQMIFQDAATSMNRRFSARKVIEEPLLLRGWRRSDRQDLAERLMRDVALAPEWLSRSVMEFSGGQRQRLAIARALTLRPKLLVLDEALSGLDLSSRAQIANLLLDLQKTYSLTYLLISHDLGLLARMSNDIAVMAHGRIVEKGEIREVVAGPKHPETIKLLAAAKAGELKIAAGTSA